MQKTQKIEKVTSSQDDDSVVGIKNIGSSAKNTKRSKKSQALRMTSLWGAKGTEAFVREPGRTADPSAALGMRVSFKISRENR